MVVNSNSETFKKIISELLFTWISGTETSLVQNKLCFELRLKMVTKQWNYLDYLLLENQIYKII